MNAFADAVFEQAKAYADISSAAYAEGKAEGLRAGVKRRQALEAALEEALEYFEDRYDVVDGDYGIPAANKEMQIGAMIEEALGRSRP